MIIFLIGLFLSTPSVASDIKVDATVVTRKAIVITEEDIATGNVVIE
jgi:hypothetical protein